MSIDFEYLDSCILCDNPDIAVVDDDDVCHLSYCNKCGHVFDNPRPAAHDIETYYSNCDNYASWLSHDKEREALWQRRLETVLAYKKHGTLLDIGAGIGQFLACASPHFESVYGTEVSNIAIDIAKQKYHIDLYKGQLENIDFKDAKFDNITMYHVLEHVPNPGIVLSICYSLLSPGGTLIIAVPYDFVSLRVVAKKVLKSLGIMSYSSTGKLGLSPINLDGTFGEIHLSHFYPQSLVKHLNQIGFGLQIETLDPWYASKMPTKFFNDFYYYISLAIHKSINYRLYNTMLIVCKKI